MILILYLSLFVLVYKFSGMGNFIDCNGCCNYCKSSIIFANWFQFLCAHPWTTRWIWPCHLGDCYVLCYICMHPWYGWSHQLVFITPIMATNFEAFVCYIYCTSPNPIVNDRHNENTTDHECNNVLLYSTAELYYIHFCCYCWNTCVWIADYSFGKSIFQITNSRNTKTKPNQPCWWSGTQWKENYLNSNDFIGRKIIYMWQWFIWKINLKLS